MHYQHSKLQRKICNLYHLLLQRQLQHYLFLIMTRDQYAFQVLRLMIAHDWKFDVTTKDWDTQAVERAFKIADAFIKESEITNV